MRVLSRFEVDQLLLGVGLKIGNWNELADVGTNSVVSGAYHPPQDALALYVLAGRLVNWIAGKGWTLLQIDNSTAPTDDEIEVFERLVFSGGQRWDIGSQRSFLFESSSVSPSDSDQTTLTLLIFFSLLFEWHVYMTSEHSTKRQRLALQDGLVYFCGEATTVEAARELVNQFLTQCPRQPQSSADSRA